MVKTAGIRQIGELVPDPPLPSCVAEDLSLILSEPLFSQLRTGRHCSADFMGPPEKGRDDAEQAAHGRASVWCPWVWGCGG